MPAEELLELVGRQGHRMAITGTLADEEGGLIDGTALTTKTIAIYDVATGTDILTPTSTGLSIGSSGEFSYTIKSTHMTIVNTELPSGAYERHRVLLQCANSSTPGMDFNLEFDVLVRKVKNLV